jgi:Lysozyme like domain
MKTFTRIAAVGLACLALGACSPQMWIQEVFGPDAEAATRVATCESGLDPGAVSAGGGNHGLFQINNIHQPSFEAVTGRPWSEVYSAEWNTRFAKYLFDDQGWRPWACQP